MNNNFLGYVYPIILLLFSSFFIYFYKNPKETISMVGNSIETTLDTIDITTIFSELFIFSIDI